MQLTVENGVETFGENVGGVRSFRVATGSRVQLLCSVDGAPEMRLEWSCCKKTQSEQACSTADCEQILKGAAVQVFYSIKPLYMEP